MAQLALPPGAARRRAVFGLLDADGWGWATVKATFWFVLIIFLLGYIPNLAYYFTVGNTIDVGLQRHPDRQLLRCGQRSLRERRHPGGEDALPGAARDGHAVAAQPGRAGSAGGTHRHAGDPVRLAPLPGRWQ